jgi:hypothetical protein
MAPEVEVKGADFFTWSFTRISSLTCCGKLVPYPRLITSFLFTVLVNVFEYGKAGAGTVTIAPVSPVYVITVAAAVLLLLTLQVIVTCFG